MLAFTSCYGLENITIGASVATIGDVAFEGCKNLKSITFKGATVPTIGAAAFASVPTTCTIYVTSDEAKAAFEADSNFSGYSVVLKEETGIDRVSDNQTAVKAYEGYVEVETESPARVRVITLQGQVLYSQPVEGAATIDLAPGLYIVTVGEQAYKALIK